MSVTVGETRLRRRPQPGAPRRVRQEARDALAVAAFSAGASTGLAVVLTFVLTRVG